jgi:hypothetical protein
MTLWTQFTEMQFLILGAEAVGSYEVSCDPVQEGSHPGVDTRISRFRTPEAIWHNTNQVESLALGPHERPTRVTL